MKKWIVMESQAKMPHSCWGSSAYRNIALVELRCEKLGTPKMISTRARNIRRIISARYGIHLGRTSRSAGQQVLAEYHERAASHNATRRMLREMNVQ